MRGSFFTFLILLFTISAPVQTFSAGRTVLSYPQKQPEKREVEISFVDNRIKVNHATLGSKLEVYSIVGLKVLEVEIKHTSGEYPVNLSKGYYIVRVEETVRKIVVR